MWACENEHYCCEFTYVLFKCCGGIPYVVTANRRYNHLQQAGTCIFDLISVCSCIPIADPSHWTTPEVTHPLGQALGRVGEPDEVGELICFLVSDKALFLTGECVNIDGGRSVCREAVFFMLSRS